MGIIGILVLYIRQLRVQLQVDLMKIFMNLKALNFKRLFAHFMNSKKFS